jgi:hypothetical protein
MWLRIARLGAAFVRVPEVLVVYRMAASSMSRKAIPFFEAGRAVILRGHASDPRVPEGAPEYAEGCRTPASEAVAQWAIHAACIAIAQDEVSEAGALFEIAHHELVGGLRPPHFASRHCSLLYGAALTPTRMGELWFRVGRSLIESLVQFETRLGRSGFAMEALLQILDCHRQQERIIWQQQQLDSMLNSRTWRIASRLHQLIDRLPWMGRALRRAHAKDIGLNDAG